MKEVGSLTPSDLRAHPVWRFSGSDARGETMVRPLKRIPVSSLNAAIAACDVILASGKVVLGSVSNVDAENADLNQHFVTLSVFRDDGQEFHLARYHDIDADRRGPKQLARFLGMKLTDVFPIRWDVRHLIKGAPAAAAVVIHAEPPLRLSRAEIIGLAVRG